MPPSPVRILSLPGIKRDGTVLEGDFHVDGQWCRWQRGLPRKMGGYSQISSQLSGPVREVNVDSSGGQTIIHSFSSTGIERIAIDNLTGVPTSVISRTPAGFVSNANYEWTSATIYNAGGSNNAIVAHVAPNLGQIDNEVGGLLYLGATTGTGAFTQITDANVTGANALAGGVVALHPYLCVFGQAGGFAWSRPNEPEHFNGAGAGFARITQSKLVAGMPLRGGPGSSPSGLLWSTDSLLRAYFTGGQTVFAFDTISDSISIMSPNAIVEFEGIFYWVGIDKFYMFNGVVREMPNTLNLDWFFEGLNFAQRSKVFAFSIPRYGEIWFCYPRGTATECSHAVVFNTRESALAGRPVWYDTELPVGGRTTGISARVFPRPLMVGATPHSSKYRIYQHELGTDAVEGTPIVTNAIDSYFETADISMPKGAPFGKAANQWLRVSMIEPDFVQSGDMTVQITGTTNARANEVNGAEISFPATPSAPHQQIVPSKEARRNLRFKFRSNAIGGNYKMGYCLAHVEPSDGTVIG
jgi:hypothetical protein